MTLYSVTVFVCQKGFIYIISHSSSNRSSSIGSTITLNNIELLSINRIITLIFFLFRW